MICALDWMDSMPIPIQQYATFCTYNFFFLIEPQRVFCKLEKKWNHSFLPKGFFSNAAAVMYVLTFQIDFYIFFCSYACVEGVAEEYTCSPGLWFDECRHPHFTPLHWYVCITGFFFFFSDRGVCNWPTETERSSCSTSKYSNKSSRWLSLVASDVEL